MSSTRKRQFSGEGNSTSSNSRKRTTICNNEISSNPTQIAAGLKTDLNKISDEEMNRRLKLQMAKINRSLNMQRVNAEREQRKKLLQQEAQKKT